MTGLQTFPTTDHRSGLSLPHTISPLRDGWQSFETLRLDPDKMNQEILREVERPPQSETIELAEALGRHA